MDKFAFNKSSIPKKLSIRDRLLPENLFAPKWLFQCQVKILVITDSGSGGFGTSTGFHLGQVLDVINDDPWSHINFSFTKAHRQVSGGVGVIDNFDLSSHDLNQYSQIWLFGINRQSAGGALSEIELRHLTEFMDAGGGVFATGDHEDLGNPLAAEVPRVRSMRRWYYPNPGPNGEPVAPAQSGANRHDTLVGGGTQTDAEPQEIRPRYYYRFLGGSSVLLRRVKYPHPVLCGPHGVINYLPDHMHEGLCEAPSDLTKSYTFDGAAFDEYPSKNGNQEAPEVIAWATNNVTSDEFGVLAAYDGHEVDVGRVVVDATWHHWFNINIAPYVNASNPTHVSYTPATVAKFDEIKDYYRNVAVWLAKPSLQSCIRNGGWIRVLGDFDIAITFRKLDFITDKKLYYWQLGIFAKDALGRSASQCQLLQWIIWYLYPQKLTFQTNPFKSRPVFERLKEVPEALDLDELETVALGSAIHSALEAFGDVKNPEKLLDDDGRKFEAVLKNGASIGIKEFAEFSEKRHDAAKSMMREL